MMAYMNAEAYDETLAGRQAVYFSRSRQRLWRKGEESGNVQKVKKIFIDCDRDTLLLKVEQTGGAACHEGYKSCFFREVTPEGFEIIAERVFDPKEVYKNNVFHRKLPFDLRSQHRITKIVLGKDIMSSEIGQSLKLVFRREAFRMPPSICFAVADTCQCPSAQLFSRD